MASTADNPAELIADIIGPRVKLEAKLMDIAEKTGITIRRVKAYFHGEVAKPRPIEVRALRQLRDEVEQEPAPPAGFVSWNEFERVRAERDAEIAKLKADLDGLKTTIGMALAAGLLGHSEAPPVEVAHRHGGSGAPLRDALGGHRHMDDGA